MKQLFLFTIAVASLSALAQTPFEGRIVYDVSVFKQTGSGSGEMTIYFSKPGIRLEFAEAKSPGNPDEIEILNFDSGCIYKLNPKTKSYTVRPLREKQKPGMPANKLIAGYSTSPFLLSTDGFLKEAASVFGAAVFYPADSLFYPVPEKYVTLPQLLMVNKGRIVLGGDFYPPNHRNNPWNLEAVAGGQTDTGMIFKTSATAVTAQKNSALLFVAPAGYKKSDGPHPVTLDSTDSVAMMLDTAVAAPALPLKKVNKTSKKNKRPTKKSAGRREDD